MIAVDLQRGMWGAGASSGYFGGGGCMPDPEGFTLGSALMAFCGLLGPAPFPPHPRRVPTKKHAASAVQTVRFMDLTSRTSFHRVLSVDFDLVGVGRCYY